MEDILEQIILSYFGIISLKSGDSSTKRWVKCKVDESRYKIEDGYKVTLKALDESYGKEDYYQTDFESLLKSGLIIEDNGQKPVKIVQRISLGGNAYIENSGYVLE